MECYKQEVDMPLTKDRRVMVRGIIMQLGIGQCCAGGDKYFGIPVSLLPLRSLEEHKGYTEICHPTCFRILLRMMTSY
jgi:hypothetical protein